MKRIYKFLTGVAAVSVMFAGCKSLDYYDTNPNQAALGSAPPSLILTTICADLFNLTPCWSQYQGWAQYVASYSSQQGDLSFQGYSPGAMGFGYYNQLRYCDDMVSEADRTNAPAYRGLANFFKAYCYSEMTKQAGDIPMSDAMKGQSDFNFTPKYDAQKSVFLQCFDLLEEANTILGQAANEGFDFGSGDIMYQGSAAKWQKAVNALYIRLIMDCQKKVNDADLNLKARLQKILDNPTQYPIYTSQEDSFTFHWYDQTDNRYLIYYQVANLVYYRLGNTYYNLIKKYDDQRISVVASRTKNAQDAEPNASSFNVDDYGGVDCNASYAEIDAQKDDASEYNAARYTAATGEPMMIVGYPEMCFNIAEACQRGWLTGQNAANWYEAGIRGSMQYYELPAQTINNYISSSVVSLQSGDEGLQQILEQKYIAFFNNSGWQPFYEMRRTGIPAYQIGANMSNPSGKVPVRWMYPTNEYNHNKDNVNAALMSQWGSTSDSPDALMWILQ